MKIWTTIRDSVRVYARNFTDLMLAFLLQALLRGMCLAPLLFLLDAQMAPLAWLCVPMFVLLVLPARQNYALAMQDMLHGGRVLSPRLISFDRYFFKLWRGLVGLMKAALWLALPVTAIVLLMQLYEGSNGNGLLAAAALRLYKAMQEESFTFGSLFQWAEVDGRWVLPLFELFSTDMSDGILKDGFVAMRWFGMFSATGKLTDGLKNLLMIIACLWTLPVIGCMVHIGARHAVALEDKKLLRGKRLKLWIIGVLSLMVFLPFLAVAGVTLGSNLKLFISGLAEMYLAKSFTVPELGERLYLIAGAFVLLFIPMVPLKQLMPAVAVHRQMRSKYEEIKTDAEA